MTYKIMQVQNCPTEELALTNCAIVCLQDFKDPTIKHVKVKTKTGSFVFSIMRSGEVPTGSIGLNLPQLRWAVLTFGESIHVRPYVIGPKKHILTNIVLTADVYEKTNTACDSFETENMSEQFLAQINGHHLTVGQALILSFPEKPTLLLVVKDLVVGESDDGSKVFYVKSGICTTKSTIDFIKAEECCLDFVGEYQEYVDDSGMVLRVLSVDTLKEENGADHNTSEYHLMNNTTGANLVLRRGQPFNILLNVNRNFDSETDAISFIFTVADAKSPGSGTLIAFPLVEEMENTESLQWWAKLVEVKNSTIKVQLQSSASCVIGSWNMEVDTKHTTKAFFSYSFPDPLHFIFNPWCKDDGVYLDDEKKREEYVLSDNGLIWRNSRKNMRAYPWNFAQFEDSILDCGIYLLNSSEQLSVAERADPILVSKALSTAVGYVLEGRWEDDYSDGIQPRKWQGSLLILQKYWATKERVKYGQCWVFSGVFTTVCRALGIPCRPITNFSSAHDMHGHLTIDTFIDSDGNVIEDIDDKDTIWNYHVWNEVWLKRPDLEDQEYDGWQAIDSTPQERSGGVYPCGPASLAAIKKGEIKLNYDTAFIFSEVNAHHAYWRQEGEDMPAKLIRSTTKGIGLSISTKAVGESEREDITHQYKWKESSPEQEEVFRKALRQCNDELSLTYLNEAFVRFNLHIRDDIVIGDTFNVEVTVTNNSATEDFKAQGTLLVNSVYHTGKLKSHVKKNKFNILVEAGTLQTLTMPVSYHEYAPKLSDEAFFKISFHAIALASGYEFFTEESFHLSKPDVIIEAPEEICVGDPFDITVWFKNPLPTTLNRPKFTIEGNGFEDSHKIILPEPVEIGADALVSVTMNALKSGKRPITVKFNSKELKDVSGYLVVNVSDGK